MTSKIKSFDTPQDVANAFAERLIELLNQAKDAGTTATVCLSGGSTPKLLFKTLAKDHADIDWSPLHIFWGDERCVPADSGESNYGEADRLFLRDANIPAENIHAVNTSLAPGSAADDYQRQIEAVVAKDLAGKPAFDLMVLEWATMGIPHRFSRIKWNFWLRSRFVKLPPTLTRGKNE